MLPTFQTLSQQVLKILTQSSEMQLVVQYISPHLFPVLIDETAMSRRKVPKVGGIKKDGGGHSNKKTATE